MTEQPIDIDAVIAARVAPAIALRTVAADTRSLAAASWMVSRSLIRVHQAKQRRVNNLHKRPRLARLPCFPVRSTKPALISRNPGAHVAIPVVVRPVRRLLRVLAFAHAIPCNRPLEVGAVVTMLTHPHTPYPIPALGRQVLAGRVLIGRCES